MRMVLRDPVRFSKERSTDDYSGSNVFVILDKRLTGKFKNEYVLHVLISCPSLRYRADFTNVGIL